VYVRADRRWDGLGGAKSGTERGVVSKGTDTRREGQEVGSPSKPSIAIISRACPSISDHPKAGHILLAMRKKRSACERSTFEAWLEER
jgi:hypothetical protein